MRYAMVNSDGVVVNICEWDGNSKTWQPPSDIEMIQINDGDLAEPGGSYADGVFTFNKLTDESYSQPARRQSIAELVVQAKSFEELKSLVSETIAKD